MRRLQAEQWAGLAMLVLAVAFAGAVLVGATPVAVPRGLWIAVFAVLAASLLLPGTPEPRPRVRYAAVALAFAASAVLVLTGSGLGYLPLLLVITAAATVEIASLSLALVVVGVNTVVLAVGARGNGFGGVEALVLVGFYFFIQLATVLVTAALRREQRTRRELVAAHVELRAASVLLAESARTAERLRISRELHDLIGHQLAALTLELEAARHREGAAALGHVERANAVARALLADVRATVGALRQSSANLADAMQQVVSDLPGLAVSITVDPAVEVGEEATAALVRAAQEIVTNTVRHSGATTLRLEIRAAPGAGAVLTAADDGRGAGGLVLGHGLRGLVERFEALGGEVCFDGSDGFRVVARVPS